MSLCPGPADFVLATQWYFIVLYAVISLVLVATVILTLWCCYTTRHHWFEWKEVVVRKRVSKKKFIKSRRKSQSTGQGMELAHGQRGGGDRLPGKQRKGELKIITRA